MDRRNVLLGLTGAATPLLVGAGPTPARAAASTTATTLDPATYVTQTAQVGTLSYMTSQLALQTSSNFFVRGFATLESQEQIAIAQSLNNTFNPSPAPLTPEQQQMVRTLQGLSGSAFDKAYLQAQIAGHNQLLAFQQQFLTGATDPTSNLVHVALISLTFINTHIGVLGELVQSV